MVISEVDTLLDAAIVRMQEKDVLTATQLLEQAMTLDQHNPETLSLYGHCLVQQGNHEGLSFLKQAVDIEPEDAQWNLNYGEALYKVGEFIQAQTYLKAANQAANSHEITLVPLIKSFMSTGDARLAQQYAERLVRITPKPAYKLTLARIYSQIGKFEDALLILDSINTEPLNEALVILKSEIYLSKQDYTAAQQILNQVTDKLSRSPSLALKKLYLLQALGNISEAKELFNKFEFDYHQFPELLSLGIDLGVKFDINIATAICHDTSFTLFQRRQITYSLARGYDRNAEYEKAWQLSCMANQLYHKPVKYLRENYESKLVKAIECYRQTHSLAPDTSLTPIFIIGAPRVGATLIQSVLCAPKSVHSLEERGALLPHLLPFLEEKSDEIKGQMQAQLTKLQYSDLAGIRDLITPETTHVIDKTPHHILVVGLLKRIYPNAYFVEITRTIEDSALSIFMHDFNNSFDYARNYHDACDYLAWHSHAANAWRKEGIEILSCDYQSFVEQPELISVLFDALGIEYNVYYLSPENRNSASKTFSVLSSKQKVNSRSVGKANRYRSFIS